MRVVSIFLFCLLTFFLVHAAVKADRKISEEAVIFKQLRDGVFTIFGEEGHGSGFLIDSKGLVLTNQHVVANSSRINVLVNDSIKVAAKLLKADEKMDVAVILIHPSIVRGLPVLKLSRNKDSIAFEGEKVIAIGSPLHQEKILTSGIISKVLETAIISDVNINPGNSGGPLINMDGEVIAINTFGEQVRPGPGVSGSILVTQALNLIEDAIKLSNSAQPPEPRLLPVMPKTHYPLSALEYAASIKKRDTKPYNLTKLVERGKFNIFISTPPYLYRAEKQYELDLSKRRRAREEKGNVGKEGQYNPFDDLKNWYQYLGGYSPTVVVAITPKIGETSGSAFGNLLGAVVLGTSYHGSHEYEYKGDLGYFSLSVNGLVSPEIEHAMIFEPLDFLGADYYGVYEAKDIARSGVFTFPCEIFKPINGSWPDISLKTVSIDKPNDTTVVVVPRQTIEQVWLDFEPYREQMRADSTRLVAKP